MPSILRLKGFALLTLVLSLTWTTSSGAAEADSDPQALAIAEASFAAMGGQQGLDAARFLRFNFFGFRLHHWDRATGRHRLEGKTREGVDYVVLHNLNSREGVAFINGARVEGEAAQEWLGRAYEAWINDTYWLLMPYKLRDPGVHLKYDGEEVIEGKVYDKLKLSFEKVGLTPGDIYWAYINRETKLMDRWAYFLESSKPEQPPTQWAWLEWQKYGPIWLSAKRLSVGAEPKERLLSDLAVLENLPDAAFSEAAPVAR
jgi:hypothetical protein